MADAYDFSFDAIEGGPLPLTQFKGRPMLVVNTASKCGLTPQYEGLEKLYETYKDRGLVVLGTPANDFLWQEPGTDSKIAAFCQVRYGVTFPLTSKVHVKGKNIHPFWAWAKTAMGSDGVPKWNFHKLLIGKDGLPIGSFGSRTPPQDPEIAKAVEAAL